MRPCVGLWETEVGLGQPGCEPGAEEEYGLLSALGIVEWALKEEVAPIFGGGSVDVRDAAAMTAVGAGER